MLTRADKLIFNNVRLTGWQDTLQADGGNRQYFRNCYIEGNVDWIFGSAQAVFDDCDIVANGEGHVTAASTESTRSTGYVFINSRLLKKNSSVADNKVTLGRPWRSNACVTYVNCFMDSHIKTAGYTDMGDNSYKAAQFYEYQSYGPGFAVNTDRRQLSKAQGEALTVNGVFARESGAGAAFATAWDALATYADLSKNYIAENVVEQVDFKKLDAAISRAEALREADYKDFRAVKAALLAAKALDRENATQADADKLAADITTAIANLEAATPDPTPGPTPGPTPTPTPDPTPTPAPTPTPDPTPTPTPGTGDSNGNGGNSQGTTEDNNNDESDNEQSRTEESVATGERGFSLWYALSAAIASLGAGLALTGKKRRKDEE